MSTPDAWTAPLSTRDAPRAHALALQAGADAALTAALDDLVALQEAVRARAYLQAHAHLTRYRADLDDTSDAPTLWAHADPDALHAAVTALQDVDGARITDPADLEARLAPALENPWTRAEALNVQGVLYALGGDVTDARAAFQAALDLDARHYRALTNLGNLDLEAGAYADAERQYRAALALHKDYPGAHHNLAVALRKQKRMGESLRSFKTGQRLAGRQERERTRVEMQAQSGKLSGALPRNRLVWIAGAAVVGVLLLRNLLGG
ncbi:tetratricopeptide repeat protein [Deinococcus maricopensis]|uniref:Tetratricopeptide TPR_2 repeat-containing protein n=1 Tax=Deinococcus maricopensis (strain DSM 21211 / LMG 22137 / NRRL B-23946 / LB-34) TaxID=709986 RepID=E8UBA6_DEIML|nr:tetratricopeptide repeat protein [Deinococcus maricopensis]ADV68345.1 Tetratricopeptide TPR_2 repeat-containing protein [Deinococcus maricopensis DSM 21211]